jgi:hypothetical protein
VVLEVFSESWLRRSLLHQYRNPLFLRLALVSIQVGFHTVCLIYAVRPEGAFHQCRERCINRDEFCPVTIGKIGRLANPRDIRQRHDKAGV